ncbi:antirestriction protein (plasmid) [Pseudomonas silvicola]|nr:antirestriction protein [Pseudomonas silvicola]WAH62281.1 antirestriction protein [Pseudomonas silvicola]
MSIQASTPAAPVATLVPDYRRLTVLPRHFGSHMILVENCIYDSMSELCNAYHGGFWAFYETSNGALFMVPTAADEYELLCAGNYFQGTMSAEAAGIVASLYGINRACWAYREDRLITQYHELAHFAKFHPESAAIFAAID